MDREKLKNEKCLELFERTSFKTGETDPEFSDITNKFLFGEVWQFGKINTKLREIITLTSLITNSVYQELKVHTKVALKVGITPSEIKELVYACVPYIGLPKTLNALRVVNEVLLENNISLPLKSECTTTEETRYEVGVKLRNEIFGGDAKKNEENAIKGQEHIQRYLSSYCFGDWYSRTGLDIKTRELITMTILINLGGCENQLIVHLKANFNVGNDYETIVNVITQILPYVGFPRTLNALNCLNKVMEDANEK